MPDPDDTYDSWTDEALREYARELGLTGHSTMDRQSLLDGIGASGR